MNPAQGTPRKPVPPANPPLVVIVLGAPCTGKTTIAKRVSAACRLPLIYKDGLKEILFDTLGWGDPDWSHKLGLASILLLHHLLETQLRAGCSCVVEANFDPHLAVEEFLDLKRRHPFTPLQVFCTAAEPVRQARFASRTLSGERHPGHTEVPKDPTQPPIVDHSSPQKYTALDIGGQVIELDTTDFARIDYPALFKTIRAALPIRCA